METHDECRRLLAFLFSNLRMKNFRNEIEIRSKLENVLFLVQIASLADWNEKTPNFE